MRPLRLRLRGITRFRSEVDLDLSTLPPGVIAVVGANGAGKSTVLECLAPLPLYLELPSYAGRLGDSVSRGVRDAFVELTQEYAGSTWRHLVQIDPDAAGGAGKTEAYLYRDGLPVAEQGRLSDYKQAVGRYFPASGIFYASSFSAQRGNGNFFELDKQGRRDLFASLLGLADLQRSAERAARHRLRLDKELARIDALMAGSEALSLSAADLRSAVASARVDLAQARLTTEAADSARSEALHRENAANMTYSTAQRLLSERDALALRLQDEVTAAEAAVRAKECALADARDALDRAGPALSPSLRAELEAQGVAARAETEAVRERGTVAAAALASAEAARFAARTEREVAVMARIELQRAEERVAVAVRAAEITAALEATLRSYVADPANQARVEGLTGRALARAVLDLHAQVLDALERRLRAARDTGVERDRLSAEAALLGQVPCQGEKLWRAAVPASEAHKMDVYLGKAVAHQVAVDCAACPLLERATSAAARVGELVVEDAVALAAEVATARLRLSSIIEAKDRLHQSVDVAADLAARRADLATAQARPVPPEVDAAALDQAVTAATAAKAEQETAWRAAMQRQRQAEQALAEADRREADRREAVGRAEASVATLTPALADASQRLEEAQRRLGGVAGRDGLVAALDEATARCGEARREARATDDASASARAAEAALDREAARLQGQLDLAEAAVLQRLELAGRRERVAEQQRAWVLLERGLGRDGIQALEVDAAGPEVSAILNELLVEVFGSGRFAARLVTVQEAGRGRVQKEVFDLEVIDGAGGSPEPRSADRFSAGERTLISEALKLAIAIYSARRTSHPIETLYRDECDGPLEEGLAERYPAMLRRALELGGYRNVLVISHRESVWAQADALIRVGGGQALIEAA